MDDTSLGRQPSVRDLSGFFEGLARHKPDRNILRKPQNPSHPYYQLLDESTHTATAAPPLAPIELEATPQSTATEKTLRGVPLAVIRENYFNKPSKWVICAELEKAVDYHAPLEYQERLFDLLLKQHQKLYALDQTIAELDQHKKTPLDPVARANIAKKNKPYSFCQSILERFSSLWSTFYDNHPMPENILQHLHTHQACDALKDLRPLSSYRLEQTQADLEQQSDLRKYAQEFINIFSSFLSLTKETNYQTFLNRMIEETCIQSQKSKHPFKKLQTYLHAHQHTHLPQEELNAQFKSFQAAFSTHRMKKLNIEFRQIMQRLLYSRLLQLRSMLCIRQLWIDNNPFLRLYRLGVKWILEHQNFFEPYLIRLDSEHSKIIPILYPIYIKYTVKTIEMTQEGERIQYFEEEKIDDALRWIERMDRWKVDPLEDLKLNTEDATFSFSNEENFMSVLRNGNNPKVSFYYSHKDSTPDASFHPKEMIVTVKLLDITPVKDLYFWDLKAKLQHYLKPPHPRSNSFSSHSQHGPQAPERPRTNSL